jgi:hypothetical protein
LRVYSLLCPNVVLAPFLHTFGSQHFVPGSVGGTAIPFSTASSAGETACSSSDVLQVEYDAVENGNKQWHAVSLEAWDRSQITWSNAEFTGKTTNYGTLRQLDTRQICTSIKPGNMHAFCSCPTWKLPRINRSFNQSTLEGCHTLQSLICTVPHLLLPQTPPWRHSFACS